MYTIAVQSVFSSAHYHSGADKECKQVHGHNYRVEVQVEALELKDNMVVDFGLVRQVLREALDPWDHHLLNDLDDFSGMEPTTEIICRKLYNKLSSGFPGSFSPRRVTIWETDDCWASYEK
ncbi:MAG: 6-carboxytetrahydropterin synthase [Elusimicrobiota bacterium]|nr:6-carboxytetrahydropterin synthase [Elusimicrobiota bacterium]